MKVILEIEPHKYRGMTSRELLRTTVLYHSNLKIVCISLD